MLDNDTVVSRLPEIDGTAIKVYLALARRADSSGRCWPSVATIGRDTGICGRSVQYALRRLTDLGLLTIDQQTGKAAVYCLTRASSCTPTNTGDAPGCTTPLHRDAPGGASTCTTPLHRDAPKQETGKHPRTTPKEQHPRRAAAPLPFRFPWNWIRRFSGRHGAGGRHTGKSYASP